MGFESLYGAVVFIEEIETIVVDGKDYTHIEQDVRIIGKLTDEEIDISYGL